MNKFATRIGESWAISVEDLQNDTVAVPVASSVMRYVSGYKQHRY